MQTFAQVVDVVAHQSFNERGERMTVEQIAERIGKPANYMRKALSQYDDAHPLRADLVVPVTLATKNYAILQHQAEAVGGVFVLLPARSGDAACGRVFDATTGMVSSFSQTLNEVNTAIADRRITVDEAVAYSAKARELVAKVLASIHAVEDEAGIPHDQAASVLPWK